VKTELPRAEGCETCRFSVPVVPDHCEPRRCLRFPPQYVGNPAEDDSVDIGGFAFPWVAADDWCGEWRARDGKVWDQKSGVNLYKFWHDQGLNVRASKAASRLELVHVEALAAAGERRLRSVRGCGPVAVAGIRKFLAARGLTLAE
jgi:hypothetical protein